jgi:sporulation protein YlmC with PRC-barrel domain
MRTLASTAIVLALATTFAGAQTPPPAPPSTPPTMPQAQPAPAPRVAPADVQMLTSIPANAATVTHWYKQPVYDHANARIGEIDDVLVDRDGKVTSFIIGVGGFLGMGERHVAVPFNAVQATTKDNNKWYLVMNTTKDALKVAPHFKYDRTALTWIPEAATTGTSTPAVPRTNPPVTPPVAR